MSSFFEPPKVSKEKKYNKYSLERNPFQPHTLDALKADRKDRELTFSSVVFDREVEKLTSEIGRGLTNKTYRSMWLFKSPAFSGPMSVRSGGRVFSNLVCSKNPRFLPVYAALPHVFEDVTGRLYDMMMDRLLPRYLKYAVYSLIYQELKTASSDKNASEQLLPEIDAGKLVEEIDKTEGKALDEIFFPKKKQPTYDEEIRSMKIRRDDLRPDEEKYPTEEEEGKEQGESEEKESEELAEVIELETEVDEETEGEEEEKEAEVEEIPVDPRKEPLISFIKKRIDDPAFQFGKTVQEGIIFCLNNGFLKGHRYIRREVRSRRDELRGLISLIKCYFNGIVIILDQLNSFRHQTEPDQISFLSSIFQFRLLAQEELIIVFTSKKPAFEDFDSNFTKGFKHIHFNLSWMKKDSEETGKDDKMMKEMVADFLKSAHSKKTDDIAPFTDDGLKLLIKKSEKDPVKLIKLCGDMINKGSKNDFPAIDKKFVTENLTKAKSK